MQTALATLPSKNSGLCLKSRLRLHTGHFQVPENSHAHLQTHWLRDADRLLAVIDWQRSGTESPNNGSPVFSPNPARNVELELHLVYLAVWVLMGDDPSPFKVIFRYGDLDRGRYIVAKKGDLDAGILFSLLLQIKLHEAVVHTVWGTGCSLEIDPHFLGERLNLDTTSFHQSWT